MVQNHQCASTGMGQTDVQMDEQTATSLTTVMPLEGLSWPCGPYQWVHLPTAFNFITAFYWNNSIINAPF